MAGKYKICLIDDEFDLTELCGSLLRFGGFEVTALNNSVAALKELETNHYDIVVADLMMPDLDGISLMRKLRGTERYARTPIFALSAKKLSDDERKFLHTADIRFVQKPFEPSRFVGQIQESVKGV